MGSTHTPEPKPRRLIPVVKWNKFHPWPTVNGLRYYIHNQHTNGLAKSGAILRVGARILIDQDRFHAWVDSQNGVEGATS